MHQEIEQFEPVTLKNFNARRYLLANKHLYSAFGDNEAKAERHFREYGINENRLQLTKSFVASDRFENYLRTLSTVINVFEPATPENFNARRYLLANRDLHAGYGDDETAAARHFYECGLREGRQQVSAAFLSTRREKFARFKDTLPACNADSFPVSYGKSLYQLSDYSAESPHGANGFWVAELDNNPQHRYADIGAGLRDVVFLNCAYVEVYPSLTADVLIDPDCKLPFKDASLDGIGCFAVLEHVDKPWELGCEFARVVKPGGKIFIDWPFLQPMHGYPSHYYNATREGLRNLFAENFEVNELYTGLWEGPDYTVNWVLNSLLSNIKDEPVRERLLNMSLGELVKHPPPSEIWRAVLAAMDDDATAALSCANFLIGTRK